MTNRHAADPCNSLINYGTRLGEIEATTLCHAMGLDPYLGLLHATRNNRPALVLDLIEPARAVIETTILDLTEHRTFRKADFAELTTGEIRVLAPLSHDLADALMPRLRDTLGPVIEDLAQQLAALSDTGVTVPTNLTRAHNTASAPTRKKGVPQMAVARSKQQLWSCPDCGSPVTNSQRVRCENCIDMDPRHTAEIRGRRSRAIAARRAADRAWRDGGGREDFDQASWPDIQRSLSCVKLADIVAATGLSKSFASAIRAGRHRPHPSHWARLQKLGESATSLPDLE